MSPNFWGCRCCGPGYCVIRCLDHDGNQLWTWKDHTIWRFSFGFRTEGFSVNAAGYVAICGGNVEVGSVGLIDSDGVTVWDYPSGFGSTAFYYPAVDDLNNVYAVSNPSGTTTRVHCFDATGTEVWNYDLSSVVQSTLYGCFSNGSDVFVTWRSAFSNPYDTFTVTCFDNTGSILGSADYGPSTSKMSNYGTIGLDLSGNVLVPYYNYPGGGIDGGVDVLDSSCSLVANHPVSMGVYSGVADDGAIYGIGELSDGNIAIAAFRRLSISSNHLAIWDCTADALRFDPTYKTGTVFNRGPINTVFSGNGSVFFIEERLGLTGKILNKSDESGSVQFRILETDRSPEIPTAAVYSRYQVACNADRIFISSGSRRLKSGWTLE